MVGYGKSRHSRLVEPLETRVLLSAAIADVRLLAGDIDGDGTDDVILAENVGENTTAPTRITWWSQATADAKVKTYVIPHVLESRAADFSGDGRVDLLFSRREPGTGTVKFSIVWSDATGHFDLYNEQPVKGLPFGQVIGTGDDDGDGKSDLYVRDSSAVRVLGSKGDGAFTPRKTFILPHVFEVKRVADFNSDGRVDLAYTIDNPLRKSIGPDGIAIALNNGKGGYLPSPKRTMVIPHVFDSCVGDFSGDGKLDFGIISPRDATGGRPSGQRMQSYGIDQNGSLVLTGEGDLPDSPVPLSHFAAGDIDGDGVDDLVAVGPPVSPSQGPASGGTVVYAVSNPLYTGGGKEVVNPLFESNKRTIGGEDCDDLDIDVIANWDSLAKTQELVSIHNTGDITTGPSVVEVIGRDDQGGETRKTFVIPHVLDAHVADFNGDGAADVLVVRREAGSGLATGRRQHLAIYFNDGFGRLARIGKPVAIDGPVAAVAAVGDLNGDGKADMIIHRDLAARNLAQPLISKGDGSFEQRKTFVMPHVLEVRGIADFNGDGNADLAYSVKSPRDSASGQATGKRTHKPVKPSANQPDGVAILRGLGTGNFGQVWQYISPTPLSAFVLGDFDGDGVTDAGLVAHGVGGAGAGKVSLISINHDPLGNFIVGKPVGLPDSFATARKIQAADLNGDGRADLIGLGEDGVSIAIDETGVHLTERAVSANGVKFCDVAVGDLDGDGLADLIGFAGGDIFAARNLTKPGGTLEFGPWHIL